MKDVLIKVGNLSKEQLKKVVDAIVDFVIGLAIFIYKFFKGIVLFFYNIPSNIWTFIKNLPQNTVTFFKWLPGATLRFVINLPRNIKNIFWPDRIDTEAGTVVTPPRPIAPYILIGFLYLFYISYQATGFEFMTLIEKLFDPRLGPIGMIKRFFPVEWEYYPYVVEPILETIQMSFLGSLIGSCLALPVAYFASQNLVKSRFVTGTIRILLSILRTLPILIYAVFFKLIFGLGALAGTIAIAIFTFSIVTKMLYERIETLDLGAYHAVESTGASKLRAFIVALVPSIAPIFYSISLYAFEINIRYAAILGYVGAGGIGFILDDSMKNIPKNDRTIVIILYIFVTVIVIESLSRFLRRRLS